MKSAWAGGVLLCALVLTAGAAAREVRPSTGAEARVDVLLMDEIRLRNRIDSSLAPVKSVTELNAHLESTRAVRSPLLHLSNDARDRFVRSLVFSPAGLASFDYRDLVHELSASQAYELLRLFGMQHTIRSMPGLRIETSLDKAILGSGVRPAFCTIHPIGKTGILCDDDHWHNMKCGSPGTCRGEVGSICTSNC